MDDRGDDVVRRDENIPRNYAAENYVAENYVAEVCENLCLSRGDVTRSQWLPSMIRRNRVQSAGPRHCHRAQSAAASPRHHHRTRSQPRAILIINTYHLSGIAILFSHEKYFTYLFILFYLI